MTRFVDSVGFYLFHNRAAKLSQTCYCISQQTIGAIARYDQTPCLLLSSEVFLPQQFFSAQEETEDVYFTSLRIGLLGSLSLFFNGQCKLASFLCFFSPVMAQRYFCILFSLCNRFQYDSPELDSMETFSLLRKRSACEIKMLLLTLEGSDES